MRRAAIAVALALASLLGAQVAAAQGTPQLPPPPPPPPGSQPPPQPPPRTTPRETPPPPPRERERREPPREPPRVYHAPPPVYVYERPRDEAPPGHSGFQLALRTGWSFAMGRVSGASGDTMGNTFGGQVPLVIDIGVKPSTRWFLGGFLGGAWGGAAGTTKTACANASITCTGSSYRIGFEAQYHFEPWERVDPWLGLGFSFESASMSRGYAGTSYSDGVSGFDFLHLMGGVDFRLTRAFGIGPFAELAMGDYSRQHQDRGGRTSDADVSPTALHEWLTLGVRFVFLP